MDEDLAIIAKNTRKEEIKNFFIKHKKKIYFLMGLILLTIFSTFFYLDNAKKQKAEIADKFIKASINYNVKKEAYYLKEFNEIINTHDPTYAPLALFFLIDNKVLNSNEVISIIDKNNCPNGSIDFMGLPHEPHFDSNLHCLYSKILKKYTHI